MDNSIHMIFGKLSMPLLIKKKSIKQTGKKVFYFENVWPSKGPETVFFFFVVDVVVVEIIV